MRRLTHTMLLMLAGMLLAPALALADDRQTAEQIAENLRSTGLSGYRIAVQVENGTAWLSGRVADKRQALAAMQAAQQVPSVKKVVNRLSVATGASAASAAAAGGAAGPLGVSPVAGSMPTPVPATMTAAGPPHMMPAESVGAGMPLAMGASGASPLPAYVHGAAGGVAPARFDSPHMPNYAWPSYASYPNYAALTYPKQYSPTAWPYIGPFYPYPQVPLGWRKVTLEWDNGWWMLDFKD